MPEFFDSSIGRSIISSSIVLIGWLFSQVFNNNKKQVKELKTKLETMEKEQKSEHDSIRDKLHLQALSLENIKGQLALALTTQGEVEKMREQVFNVQSQFKAIWRVLDSKRQSEL